MKAICTYMISVQFILLLLFISSLVSCNDSDERHEPFQIEGINYENFPVIDSSTSTGSISIMFACKLLNIDYQWLQSFDGLWYMTFDSDKLPDNFLKDHIKTSKTHNSIINLIDKEADFIISARPLSSDEEKYANQKGVTIKEYPIALDAFIFLTNPENPVKSLTISQIQGIYTGKIKNWKEVGGHDLAITPYIRDANSGSQELMESLVMKELNMPEWEVEWSADIINGMMPVFNVLNGDKSGICYSVNYYKENLIRDTRLNTIAINGVTAEKKTIRDRKYPLVAEIYAMIRQDTEKESMAYKLFELVQTAAVKPVIEESKHVYYE